MKNQIDIVLVNSPTHNYNNFNKFNSLYSTPLGLLYIATVLQNNGFNVELIDAEKEQLTYEQIENNIKTINPKWICINVFSPNSNIVKEITLRLSRKDSIILGGPHITYTEKEYIGDQFENVKYFIKGEGEYKILKLLKGHPLDDIEGLIYRENGSMLESKCENDSSVIDVNNLPLINRDLLKSHKYEIDEMKYADISISRGCIFNCSFCCGNKENSKKFRTRDIDNVFKEIDYLVHKKEVKFISILDDCAFPNKDRLLTFSKELINRGYEVNWSSNIPFIVLRELTDSEIQLIKRSGCNTISFGIESVVPRLQKLLCKILNMTEVELKLEQILSHSIKVKSYFMVGLPTETRNEMMQTIDFAKRIKHSKFGNLYIPRFFMFKPFPKTQLWDFLIDKGYDMEVLLNSYKDYNYTHDFYNKHSWGSKISFSEVSCSELVQVIDNFYNNID